MLKVIVDDNVMIYNVMMLMVLASLAKEWECSPLISPVCWKVQVKLATLNQNRPKYIYVSIWILGQIDNEICDNWHLFTFEGDLTVLALKLVYLFPSPLVCIFYDVLLSVEEDDLPQGRKIILWSRICEELWFLARPPKQLFSPYLHFGRHFGMSLLLARFIFYSLKKISLWI